MEGRTGEKCPECGTTNTFRIDVIQDTEIWDCLNTECGKTFQKVREKPETEGRRDYMATVVHCPNWQCSGSLYLKENESYGENPWQVPDLVCDDCGTIWKNGLGEIEERQLEVRCVHCGAPIHQDGKGDQKWLIKANAGKYKLWCPLNKAGGDHEPVGRE